MRPLSPFAIGRRWYSERPPEERKPNFEFVIVGPGSKLYTKLCRIEISDEEMARFPEYYTGQNGNGTVQEYSHKHLRKYARLVRDRFERVDDE
jgi:hypothetical protein